MADSQQTDITALVEQLIGEILDPLTRGFSTEGSEWAEWALRTSILPFRLRFAADEAEPERERRLDIVRRDWLRQIDDRDLEERWRFLRVKYYYARLLPLSYRAQELAAARADSGQVDHDHAAEVAEIRSRVNELAAEVDEHAPDLAGDLKWAISETVVDCAFTAGADVMSLRLARRTGIGHPDASE